MAEQFISIAQMFTHMNNGLPFSICYVTYDKATGRGGAVKQIAMATRCRAKYTDENNAAMAVKLKPSNNSPLGDGGGKTNPNHFQNGTVNIRVSAAGQADIRKIHVQLIRRFNGAIVK